MNGAFRRVFGGAVWAAGAILLFMAVAVGYEVVMRYFLNRPTSWVVDTSEYALVVITFLVAPWVLAREGHVKLGFLVNTLPPRAQRIMNIITSGVGALVCGVFFWYSLRLTVEAIELGSIFLKATTAPRWPIYLIMTISSLLLVFQFLRRAWSYVTARGKEIPGKSTAGL